MRVISMVPSWTETLMECGAEVVGRTRFCIHPDSRVRSIPVVGGTKNWDLDKARKLNPDLLVLDQEENPKQMAAESERENLCETLITHIQNVSDVAPALRKMAERFSLARDHSVAEKLNALATRWEKIVELKRKPLASIRELPGIQNWIREPLSEGPLVYMIWREPWMNVAPGTFIASVLELLGCPLEKIWPGKIATTSAEKYPILLLEDLPKDAVLLFSSEPYPFHRKTAELSELPFPSALIDGESFSWFGHRTLVFLEKALLESL